MPQARKPNDRTIVRQHARRTDSNGPTTRILGTRFAGTTNRGNVRFYMCLHAGHHLVNGSLYPFTCIPESAGRMFRKMLVLHSPVVPRKADVHPLPHRTWTCPGIPCGRIQGDYPCRVQSMSLQVRGTRHRRTRRRACGARIARAQNPLWLDRARDVR